MHSPSQSSEGKMKKARGDIDVYFLFVKFMGPNGSTVGLDRSGNAG